MKAVVVAAMLMACASATTPQEHQRVFADFKSAHGRKYATEEEELKRFRVFSDNMKRAEELNRANPLARFGANVFADLTAAEFKSRLNGERQFANMPKSKAAPITFGASAVRDATRQTIDWRAKGAVTHIKDQGSCGSGWAFSTTGNIEGQWYLAGNPLTSLSEQELVSCDTLSNGCGGGSVGGAIDWLVLSRNGQIVTEAAYPSTSAGGFVSNCSANLNTMPVGATVVGQRDIAKDENQMAAFVYSSGPLSVYVDASTWQLYQGGIMTDCTAGPVNHAVLITGFNDGEGSWTIKNSWGVHWGEAGYIRVQKGTNQCHITKLPTTSIAAGATPPPTTTSTTVAPIAGCNANIPSAYFNIPRIYLRHPETFSWLISLSSPSVATPPGDPSCPSPVYIGQYTLGSATPSNCITAVPTKTQTEDGCLYDLKQIHNETSRSSFLFRVVCDQSAPTLQPPAAIDVDNIGGGYNYKGTFKSNLVC